MPDKPLDPVEWELVRADIALEKARLKANGDWAKWEEFQARSNAMRAGYAAPAGCDARCEGRVAHDRGGTRRIVVGSPNPRAIGADRAASKAPASRLAAPLVIPVTVHAGRPCPERTAPRGPQVNSARLDHNARSR